jgi:hypothetical protein
MRLRIESKFVRTSFVISGLTVLLAASGFCSDLKSPTLEQVLSKGTAKGTQNFSFAVVGLLALSLATLSAARGYDMLRKKKSLGAMLQPEVETSVPSGLIEPELGAKISELTRMLDGAHGENAKLRDQLNLLSAEAEELGRAENVLKRSNVALSRECDRLKSENEMMMLRASAVEVKLAEITAKISEDKRPKAPMVEKTEVKKVKINKTMKRIVTGSKAGAIAKKKKGRGKK